jgi:4-hydroxy-3-methylbut-2-enyl diphosphate reductase
MEALRFARKGYHIFLIGHANHVEVIGTYGEVPEKITIVEPHRGQALQDHLDGLPQPPTDKLIYLTQTTLNVDDCLTVVDALKERFPTLEAPPSDDICYATTNRQNAVKAVAGQTDFFLVVGANISSNSKRLVEVAVEGGCPAKLVMGADDVKDIDLSGYTKIGLTAGASTPDILIRQVIDHLNERGFETLETYEHVDETMHFTVPYQLRQDLKEKGIPV